MAAVFALYENSISYAKSFFSLVYFELSLSVSFPPKFAQLVPGYFLYELFL